MERLRSFWRDSRTIAKHGSYSGAAAFFGISVSRSKRPVSISLKSTPLLVRPRTPDLSVALSSFHGEFDIAIEAAKPLEYDFIVDAGGYIGSAAIVFAKAFPSARIVSLEPERGNFAILERNVASYPNITPLNLALGAQQGAMMLLDYGFGEWGYSVVASEAHKPRLKEKYSVEITTVDNLLRDFGVNGIDILKLDIEGSELALLQGCPDWISRTEVIFAELHDRKAQGCTEAFNRAMIGRVATIISGEKLLSVKTR